MTRRQGPNVWTLPALVAAVLLLAGCGIADPYASHPANSATSTPSMSTTGAVTDADPAPEQGGTLPGRVRAAQNRTIATAAQPTPRAALERYARVSTNWTAATVGAVERQLASLSIAQARAQALQAAASYAHDQTLTQSGVANAGRLVAITPSLITPGRWVLVTSEQTTGKGDYAGLPATLHITYAQVTHTSSGFVVSQWAPQD